MRSWLQHHLNAQHVHCRLYALADRIAILWERVVHPLLYGGSRG